MGTLSLCADSARPPGTSTMPSPSPSSPAPVTSSLHVISDSTCHLTSPAQTPTQPPPAIHHRLFAIAHLWLRMTRLLDALLLLSLLLGLVLSWLPLTILLLSTLFVSICLTAEEIDDIIPKPPQGHKSDTLPTPNATPSRPWKLKEQSHNTETTRFFDLPVRTEYQRIPNTNGNGNNYESTWLLAVQHHNKTWPHIYNMTHEKRLPLYPQCNTNMETTRSFVHSARKWQQRPKNVSGTNCTNKHTKPTEFCAFCACKQQQRTHTRTLALSTCDPLQQHTHACNNDTKTPQTDGTTFLALSISKQQRWPNHGSETGDKTNATTLLFDIPIPNKRQQPMNESNDGIRTKNYYACLDNGETDEDDNEYSNATTNDEYKHAPTTPPFNHQVYMILAP